MFGYADESGEPGVMKNEHDYFVFCIVLFENREEALKCSGKIDEFRRKNNLSETHEFHFIKDSKKTRPAFVDFIERLNFSFISVAIKKNHLRNTASYKNMSELVLETLAKKHIDANAEMDKNPKLYKELCSCKKNYAIKLYLAEKESRGNNLIQLADYVAALKTRFLKYPQKVSVINAYSKIAKKSIGSIEL